MNDRCHLPNVIGLMGPKTHGKSTVAQILKANYGYTIINFADPIREMLRTLGIDEDHITGSEKDGSLSMLKGHSARDLMICFGESAKKLNPDIWIEMALKKVSVSVADAVKHRQDVRIVFDSVRFPNEMQSIRKMGGSLWLVLNNAKTKRVNFALYALQHLGFFRDESEWHWRNQRADFTLDMSKALDEVSKAIDEENVKAYLKVIHAANTENG